MDPRWILILVPAAALLLRPCAASIQNTKILPGFNGTQMNWIDNQGLFLLSPSGSFAFGFIKKDTDSTRFYLGLIHQPTSKVVWKANRNSPVTSSDRFDFGLDGDVRLETETREVVFSTSTGGKGATSMELRDSGNLVLLRQENGSTATVAAASTPLWQSFDHPTDTLLPGQNFTEGMALVSEPNHQNLTFRLQIGSKDMVLLAEFRTPQPYWSIWSDSRRIDDVPASRRDLRSAAISGNTLNFYDKEQSLLTRFMVDAGDSNARDSNATWAAVLGDDGFISFTNLNQKSSSNGVKVPQGSCDPPEPCPRYQVCDSSDSDRCSCPATLGLATNSCNLDIVPPCGDDKGGASKLVEVRGVGYYATGFVPSSLPESTIDGCKEACMGNCSCVALFFHQGSSDKSSGNCFLFDQIGSLQKLTNSASLQTCFLKIPSTGDARSGGGSSKNVPVIVTTSLLATATVAAVICIAVRVYKKKTTLPEPSQPLVFSDEDNFLEMISGMPVRYTYQELQEATNNFSEKLGQGGFGPVYLGRLPDGTQVAVKKLESIGQGKKEFRAEVSIIGSIHHVHLVRIRGFCAEGTHRMLVYEFMAKGSLDRWIFPGKQEGFLLDWERRFSIALGTAKGLAYLHEDCDSKIVHCDIKPENVLLDDSFLAKVSDFGLAKLMTREQSHVFTTMRGTRGYLAPEWIISSAISEKSDVYSYGMVLLEIIGGRKNFDVSMGPEKAHFPSYAFRMMEEGRIKEILDAKLQGNCSDKDEIVEIAIKVALWCIQEDVSLRPSMTKVVQMLEGVSDVPRPPLSSQMGYRLHANVFKTISGGGTATSSSAPSDCNSDALLSAVHLSGPR